MVLIGCSSDHRVEKAVVLSPAEARALISRLLPPDTTDRSGWATDIYAAFAVLTIAPTPENICAVVAITQQESSFRADPPVPQLGALAWKEIDKRAQSMGVPRLVARAALHVPSSNGKSYAERIDAVKTERELSEIFEDFIGRVPMGKTFLRGTKSRAHRWPDAGRHRLCRSACGREDIPVSCPQHHPS
jgi:hypothetical protein